MARRSTASTPPQLVTDLAPDPRGPRAIATEFRRLLEDGAELRADGLAADDPLELLERGDVPRHWLDLFGARIYLTGYRFDEHLNFLLAYVALPGAKLRFHARVFYKDSSLVWRVASHVIHTGDDFWIGKGDVLEGPDGMLHSAEETTNLPYEIQAALDTVSRAQKAKRDDLGALLALRHAPADRIEPYADFSSPRRAAEARAPIHGNRSIARFTKKNDPTSLRFARGFEPDFRRASIEVAHSASRLYNGAIEKHRLLSVNGRVQYQFVASPTHVFCNPPQALTAELTSFGLRALHVQSPEDAFIPGFEYHYLDESVDPPEFHSQIPDGYAGALSPIDGERADASAWNERLPHLVAFRRMLQRPALSRQ